MHVLLFLHHLVGPSPGTLNIGIRVNLILTQMQTTQCQPPCWSILRYFPWLWEFFLNLHSLKTWYVPHALDPQLGQISFIFMPLETWFFQTHLL